MHSSQFVPIAKCLARLVEHEYKIFNLKDEYNNDIDYGDDILSFLEGLSDKCQKIEIATVRNKVEHVHLEAFVKQANYPLLVFVEEVSGIRPLALHRDDFGEMKGYFFESGREVSVTVDENTWKKVIQDEEGNVVVTIPYSMHPLVSEDDNLIKQITGPVSRLFNLLGAEKRDIFYIYFYAVIISVIGLSLPIGVQAIIELISGGVIFNSIVLLISFVILGILIAGALQVMQYTIVEVLQRRVFVKAAFELSYRMPRIKAESILKNYAPELMNRFFDVLTIQKGLPKLLIDVTGSALQILFGLLLLAFYHPFFVFFGISLVGALVLVFYLTGPKGLKSSLVESKYKYKVAHWLEEIARALFSFKMAGHSSLPIQKMDNYVNNYLHYRKKHFRVLMAQFINIIGFKTIVTGGLLIIGSWLVIDRQITLGQFVATEIVIILILAAVEKLILSMSTIYDMLTAVEKIGFVTDLGMERKGGISFNPNDQTGMSIKVQDLKYSYPDTKKAALKGVNLDIAPGERIGIAGFNGSGKKTLAKVLSGLLESYQGMIALNNLSLRDINLSSLRDIMARNVSNDDIFDGTLLDNINMGKPRIRYKDVVWALESVGLSDFVNHLPDGLQTELIAGGKRFSESIAARLILARCIAEKPQLMVLQDALQEVTKQDKLKILDFLVDKSNPWTLLCVSNDPVILSSCDRILVMDDGAIKTEGSYEELMDNELFREILVYPYKRDVA